MTPARTVLSWLDKADRRDIGLAFLAATGIGVWRGPWAEAPLYGVLGALSLAILRIDSRRFLIPDVLVLGLVAAGLLRIAVFAGAVVPPLATACGALVLLTLFRQAAALWLGKPGLGAGDVKLIAAAALWLAPAQMPSYLFAAALSGLVEALVTGQRRLAFGRHMAPWLCLFALAGSGLVFPAP